MRILACLAMYPPDSHIGAFIATHEYLSALAAKGHDVTVLTKHPSEAYTYEGVKVYYEEALAFSFANASDAIVSHVGDRNQGHRLAAMVSKPSVRFCHGMLEDFDSRVAPDGRQPELVVFNSHALEVLSGHSGPSIVCWPHVDPNHYLTPRGEHITLVNMTRDKGVELFDQIARYNPHRKFLGVQGGYGVQVPLHRRNMTIMPSTKRIVDDVYGRTRILLMPSKMESWGMVGVEAMCSGIPVIAHPTEGLIEALGSAGTFVDRADLDGWLDAIDLLDEPGGYAEASEKAEKRAWELFEDDGRERFCDAIAALT